MRVSALTHRRGLVQGERVVWYRYGWVTLEPFESLAPGRGEVLVRVIASAVSPGTERANFLRLPNTSISYPHTPGYSAAGVVVRCGPEVTRHRCGDPVAVQAPHASHAVLPQARVHSIPRTDIPWHTAALWNLGVIALQGVLRGDLGAGTRVAVLGQGIIALLAGRLAMSQGAEVALVTRSAPSPQAKGSAHEVIKLSAGERNPEGGFEVVIEGTGDPEAILAAAALTRPGGRVVLLGSSRGATGPFDWRDVFGRRSIEVIGAHAQSLETTGTRSPSALAAGFLERIARGDLPVDDLAGDRLDPRECWRFYRSLARRRSGPLGGWFDWGVLDDAVACGPRSILRGPIRWRREESLGWERDAGRARLSGAEG